MTPGTYFHKAVNDNLLLKKCLCSAKYKWGTSQLTFTLCLYSEYQWCLSELPIQHVEIKCNIRITIVSLTLNIGHSHYVCAANICYYRFFIIDIGHWTFPEVCTVNVYPVHRYLLYIDMCINAMGFL